MGEENINDNLHLIHPYTARILKFHVLFLWASISPNMKKKGLFMKRSVLFVSMLVALSLVLTACGGTSTANHLDAVKKAGVIKVGTSADYPPTAP